MTSANWRREGRHDRAALPAARRAVAAGLCGEARDAVSKWRIDPDVMARQTDDLSRVDDGQSQTGRPAGSTASGPALPPPYYRDDAVVLYHADCLDILPLLGPVDHVITDPPFTQRTSENMRSRKDASDGGAYIGDSGRRRIDFDGIDGQEGWLALDLVAAARRWVVVFCALEQIGRFETAAGVAWVRGTVWHRTNSAPQFTGDRPGQSCEGIAIMHRAGRKRWNRGGTSLFYEGPTINSCGDRDRGTAHPTVKPQWLMSAVVSDFTELGELILDPFAGSGTTGVAAKRLGRRCILIEKEERYCEVAANRLLQGALDLGFASDAVARGPRDSTSRPRADLFSEGSDVG